MPPIRSVGVSIVVGFLAVNEPGPTGSRPVPEASERRLIYRLVNLTRGSTTSSSYRIDIINQGVNKECFLFQRSVMGILNDIYRTPRHTPSMLSYQHTTQPTTHT